MTIADLAFAVQELRIKRSEAKAEEIKVMRLLDKFLLRGEAAAWAKEWGVSAQYLSDARKGRRMLTDRVLERMEKSA